MRTPTPESSCDVSADRDTTGRRKRTQPISSGKRVTPQDRDLLWFRKIHEHGPLPSSFLLQYAKDTHRSEKRAKERLTDLFNEDNTPHGGPYLARPPQQFRTIDSRYNQLIYDLTPAGEKALKSAGFWSERSAARSGPWLHGFMVSCITASVELAALDRNNIEFIPQSQLLERADAELRFPTRITDLATKRQYEKNLIPDALFGLKYQTSEGSRYRCFLVEADRATEPATSKNFNRKSWQRSLLQYEQYVGRGLYREHLKLKSPMLVLSVVTDPKRLDQVLRIVPRYAPTIQSLLLFQSWEDFGPVFRPPRPNTELLGRAWERAEISSFRIDQA